MGAEQSQIEAPKIGNQVSFFLNGTEHNVNTETNAHLGPESLLVDYIRDEAGLKGTKFMCREGGCGACLVSAKVKDPVSGVESVRPVNSCLTPVFSCDGWDITTVEGLGNRRTGYSQIQKRLVSFNGTQCGFCTPGMVMNMHSLMNSKTSGPTAKEIEDNLDGNICRCTGYRPILDAFKSMGSDVSEDLKRKCCTYDMEDFIGSPCPLRKENGACDSPTENEQLITFPNRFIHLNLKSGKQWVKATTLQNLYDALDKFQEAGLNYKLVAGNTGTGVFKNESSWDAYVDINGILELKTSTLEPGGVVLGGGLSLATTIELLNKASELDGFEYAKQMAKHIGRVANVPVRNNGTIAGNLILKHGHPEFPSDLFLLFEAVGAKLSIASAPSLQRSYTIMEFLKLDMSRKLIVSINMDPLPSSRGYVFQSFKITRRYQNAHAYVNGAFLFKVDPKRNFSVRDKPTIVYGGISPNFVHADQTELYFLGKFLGDSKTLSGAMEVLEKEIQPDHQLPDAKPEYRKAITQSLLYKVILGILGTTADAKLRSGASEIQHNVTYGRQTYDTDKSDWPINQPVKKLEATIQCSGEAEYVNDIPKFPNELAGAFVLTKVGNARIQKVDATEALKVPGVVRFIQAKDIPGTNNYYLLGSHAEEIFVTDQVRCAGSAIGVIIAETREIALHAASLVTVTYTSIKKPILTIKDALKKLEDEGNLESAFLKEIGKSEPKLRKEGEDLHKIKGELEIQGQYHFQMEPQVTLCIPTEDGFDVWSATQWIDLCQAVIASTLNLPNNAINVSVRRLGGAYGSKISRSAIVAAASALGAHLTSRPVRICLDVDTNMKMIGKRLPYLGKYEVEFDGDGKIHGLTGQLFCDAGQISNEITSALAMICMQNCYEAVGWTVSPGAVNTNTPSNTYCRSPGSTQGIAVIETIMEHISHYLQKDPTQVRLANMIHDGDAIYSIPGAKFEGTNLIPSMIQEIQVSGEIEERAKFIENFNENNRWKKRGMALVPMRYPVHYFSRDYPCFVTIYHTDGSVAISHGGIEMGQGINTKAAQAVAYTLKIPLDKVKVKPSNNLTCPNAMVTGGAITSELVCFAATQACKILNERIAPVREKVKDDNWETLIATCYGEGIDLTAHYKPTAADDLKVYDVWGVTVTEVEVDILTGEYKIVRVDVIEDAGKSLSPEVDIGQIEGSIVMGLGLWTTENLVYHPDTGELLTTNTWEYKPPLAKDIPEDLRITMLKNAPNPFGVLRSKATGEPPLCMSVCILFALRNALNSARKDSGNTEFYQMNGPITPPDILRLAETKYSQFTF